MLCKFQILHPPNRRRRYVPSKIKRKNDRKKPKKPRSSLQTQKKIGDSPLKYKIEISGCLYEERHDLKLYAHATEMYLAISHARELIRNRLKHSDDVSDAEDKFLEELKEELWVEGIDL